MFTSSRYIQTRCFSDAAFNFIDGVLGQLSDGWGENNPRWDSYWRNIRVHKEIDGQVVIEMAAGCPLFHADDQRILEFFANNIKKTAKMALKYENAGSWKRDNTSLIMGWFHKDWTVKDCYRTYDKLKGRDMNKFKEYWTC